MLFIVDLNGKFFGDLLNGGCVCVDDGLNGIVLFVLLYGNVFLYEVLSL